MLLAKLVRPRYLLSGILLFAAGTLLSLTSLAQEPSSPVLPAATPQTPVAIETTARWLRMALAPARVESPRPPTEMPSLQQDLGTVRRQRANLYSGTIFEAVPGADEAEFQRTLLNMAQRQPVVEAEAYPALQSAMGLPAAMDPVQSATEQLRLSARGLDVAAADLEDAGKFTQADRLRGIAGRLRREARELLQPAENPRPEAASTLR